MQEIGYREYSQCEKHKSLKSPFLGAYNSRWSVKMTVILIVIDRGEGESRNPSDERELRLIQNHGDVFFTHRYENTTSMNRTKSLKGLLRKGATKAGRNATTETTA